MIAEQLVNILNDKLRNPIYKTIQLINIKDILKKKQLHEKRRSCNSLSGTSLCVYACNE